MTERAVEQQQHLEDQQAAYVKSVVGSQGGGAADQIASAKSLLDSGALTPAEFDQIKAKALA
jgi:hypothetical protein